MSSAGELRYTITADVTQAAAAIERLKETFSSLGGHVKAVLNSMSFDMKKGLLLEGEISSSEARLLTFTQRVKDAFSGLGSALSSLADKFSFVGRVAAGIIVADIFFQGIRAIREAINAYTEMEARLTTLALISTNTSKEFVSAFADMKNAAIEASQRFGVGIDDAAKGLEALIKAGFSVKDAIMALNDALAASKIEGTAVENVTRNLVMVMSQFGISASDTTRATSALINMSRLGIGTMNDFAKGLGNVGGMAKAFGLSIEETGALMVLLERRFGSADEAGTALNRVLRDLFEITTKLGISIRDTEGNLRPTIDLLTEVRQKVKELGGDMETLINVLGTGIDIRALRGLIYIAEASDEEFRKLVEEMKEGVTVQEIYIRSLGTTKTAVDFLTSSMERNLSLGFGDIYKRMAAGIMDFAISIGLVAKNTETLTASLGYRLKMLEEEQNRGALSLQGSIARVKVVFDELIKTATAEELRAIGKVFDDWIAAAERAGREVPHEIKTMRDIVKATVDEWPWIGNLIEDDAKKAEEAARNLIHTIQSMSNQVLGATKNLDSAFKDAFTLGKLMGPEGAAAGFVLLIEKMKDLERESQALKDRVQGDVKFLGNLWKENAELFKKWFFEWVDEGKIKVEDAKRYIEDLALIIEDFPKEELLGKLFEVENARKAREEAEKTRKEYEKLVEEAEKGRKAILEWAQGFLNAQRNLGMFTRDLAQLDKLLSDLREKGIEVKLSAPIQELRDFINELNNTSITLKVGIETFNMMNSAVNLVANTFKAKQDVMEGFYFGSAKAMRELSRMLREKNGLTQDEIKYANELLGFLQKENTLTADQIALIKQLLDLNMLLPTANKALKEEYKHLLDVFDDIVKSTENKNKLSLEEEATMKRLSGIQSVLNLYTQFNTVAMQAMQFAMLGNTEAAEKLTGFLRALAGATEDGYLDAQEYKDILQSLGVTFDEQGKPVFNFKSYLEELAKTVETNTQKINDLINAINSLSDKTVVVTVITRHVTEGSGSGGGEGGGGSGSGSGGSGDGGEGGGGSGSGSGGGGGVGGGMDGSGPLLLQHGTFRVPRTSLALIHEGEMVIPKPFAEEFRERISRSGSGSINININVPAGMSRSKWFEDRRYWHNVAKIIAFRLREVY
jgi:TP901 family phage tail tape measure protein